VVFPGAPTVTAHGHGRCFAKRPCRQSPVGARCRQRPAPAQSRISPPAGSTSTGGSGATPRASWDCRLRPCVDLTQHREPGRFGVLGQVRTIRSRDPKTTSDVLELIDDRRSKKNTGLADWGGGDRSPTVPAARRVRHYRQAVGSPGRATVAQAEPTARPSGDSRQAPLAVGGSRLAIMSDEIHRAGPQWPFNRPTQDPATNA
jgi:hypothetical protein